MENKDILFYERRLEISNQEQEDYLMNIATVDVDLYNGSHAIISSDDEASIMETTREIEYLKLQ